jgi:DNA-binding beta-propeller fold protein YncE
MVGVVSGRLSLRKLRGGSLLRTLIVCAPLALAAGAFAATTPQPARSPVVGLGALTQLNGPSGCLVDRSRSPAGCTRVRALRGPGPFIGSSAVALSPDGTSVYVAASSSDAIAIFQRDASSGALVQAPGTAGCIAVGGAAGCAKAQGLDGPSSVAVSADGRNVYATAFAGNAVAVFRRDPATGALSQAGDGSGCVANAAASGCAVGRALEGPDVVAVSPDGRNVYVGSFTGNAIAVFDRDASTGALTQPSDATGCVADAATTGCATGLGLGAPEGLAVSPDGANVYAATAGSGALGVFARDRSSGALTQAIDGTGCIAYRATTGCATGAQLRGANAVTLSPDGGNVYVTSLLSNSVTTFTRAPVGGLLTQATGTAACVIDVLAVGCSLGRALAAPEGLAASPDGANVYVTAFRSGAIDALARSAGSGALTQKPRRAGCLITRSATDCSHARALLGASSVAVSPDGRYVYAAAFGSDAVSVFKRVATASAQHAG